MSRIDSSYHPLAQPSEIRLLTLASGKTDDVISCSLHHMDLVPESSEYTALSYVWGGQDNQLEISLEGRIFQVTRNLHSSLRRLCQDDDDLTLSVDALCIDQANVAERET